MTHGKAPMTARQQEIQRLLDAEAEGWGTAAAPAKLTTPESFLLHDEEDDSPWFAGWTDHWRRPETYYALQVVLDVLGFFTPEDLYAAWRATPGTRGCLPLYLHRV